MNNFSIRSRILMLALLPVIALTTFFTYYNFEQARTLGKEALRDFSNNIEENRRQELKNYVELAKTSIAHLYTQPNSYNDPAIRAEA